MQQSSESQAERRAHHRYPTEHTVFYKVLYGENIGQVGEGRTLDLSSSGVRFTTESQLPVGVPVEVIIVWPVLQESAVSVKLVMDGIVVRADEHAASVHASSSEFQTHPVAPTPTR